MLRPATSRILANLALLCGLSLPLAACSTLRTDAEYNRGAHFEQLRTWAWAPLRSNDERADAQLRSAPVDRRIQSAIENDLVERGYRLTERGEAPDFYIAYHVGVDDELDARTMYRDYRVGPYFGRWNLPEDSIERYDRGTLLIDLIDAAKNELIFRGWAQADLDDLQRTRRRNDLIEDAVAEILDRLPRT